MEQSKNNEGFRLATRTGNTLDISSRFKVPDGANALKTEMLLAMLEDGRLSSFTDLSDLEKELDLRLRVTNIATKDIFNFSTDGWMNPDFWDDKGKFYAIRSGVNGSDAVWDAFTSKKQYSMACRRSMQFVMMGGLISYYKAQGDTTALDKIDDHLPSGKDLRDQYDDFVSATNVASTSNYIPGDWVWFPNPDFSNAVNGADSGEQGSNTIYLGGGRFANYYTGKTPYTLDQKLFTVYKWNHPDAKSTDALLRQLRSDPSRQPPTRKFIHDCTKD